MSYNLLSHRFCALTSILIRYRIKLDSDDVQYGGHGRLDHNTEFFTEPRPFNGRTNSMQVNISLFWASLTSLHPKREVHFTIGPVYLLSSLVSCTLPPHHHHPHHSTLHPASNMIAHLHRQSHWIKSSQKCQHAHERMHIQRAAEETLMAEKHPKHLWVMMRRVQKCFEK